MPATRMALPPTVTQQQRTLPRCSLSLWACCAAQQAPAVSSAPCPAARCPCRRGRQRSRCLHLPAAPPASRRWPAAVRRCCSVNHRCRRGGSRLCKLCRLVWSWERWPAYPLACSLGKQLVSCGARHASSTAEQSAHMPHWPRRSARNASRSCNTEGGRQLEQMAVPLPAMLTAGSALGRGKPPSALHLSRAGCSACPHLRHRLLPTLPPTSSTTAAGHASVSASLSSSPPPLPPARHRRAAPYIAPEPTGGVQGAALMRTAGAVGRAVQP